MRRAQLILLIVGAAVLTVPAEARASTPLSGGPETLASKPWWELYDDGLRAVDREDWKAALPALEEAVKQNAKSSATARTYGMRYIEYFPYFYLGLVHFKLGDMDRALANLRKENIAEAAKKSRSISRGIDFYTNAALAVLDERRARVAVVPRADTAPTVAPAPAVIDRTEPVKTSVIVPPPAPEPVGEPPRLAIVTPSSLRPVAQAAVRVSGNVLDRRGIAEVTLEVNGSKGAPLRLGDEISGGMQVTAVSMPGEVASLGKILNFSTDVPLNIGTNEIVMRAKNIRGQVTTESLTIQRVKSK